MYLIVEIYSECFIIYIENNDLTIKWLCEEAIRRYCRSNTTTDKQFNHQNNNLLNKLKFARKLKNMSILNLDDKINNILDSNDYVKLEFTDQKVRIDELQYEDLSIFEDEEFLLNLEDKPFLTLDGCSLTPHKLVELGKGNYRIQLSKESIEKVTASREIVDNIIENNMVTYGINTGFGMFATTTIDNSQLKELQVSLIRSHASGVGSPISLQAVRMLFALRINVLAKGYSGISLKTLEHMIDIYNASCLPWIPERGTVGASGDLVPLAHLALGMLGEGRMWSPITGWTKAENALLANNLEPLQLQPKEGLCMINGTQMITSIGAKALVKAENIARQADVITALTLEALRGTVKAFDPDVGNVRKHSGQIEVARRLRALLNSELHPSEIAESHFLCPKVQDAYSLRCCPQVHGIVWDTIRFVHDIIETEINSATDNPLVFPDRKIIISAGNFHGEYPAKVLDYLAIGIHELASISERRIERLINPIYSGLPAFLTERGGVNSGFMLAHVTAASLVSENKVLCHPSSVDTQVTSCGQEDHVSMGGFAARKCLQIVKHVEYVLAIELLAAAQAIEFLRPLKSTSPLEEVYKLVRSVSEPFTNDRFMAPEIESVAKLLKQGRIWDTVKPFIDNYEKTFSQ